MRWSKALDENGLAFTRQWEWEAEALAQRRGLSLKAMEDYDYFYRGTSDRPSLAINDRVSMILRSAYLRALHQGLDTGSLDLNEAERNGRRAGILADPGLWAVSPSQQPPWWPTAPAENSGEGVDDQLARLAAEALQQLLDRTRIEDETVVFAAGPIGNWSHLYANFEVRAFLQAAHGPLKPSRAELEGLPWIGCTPSRTSIAGVGYSARAEMSTMIGDWLVAPLSWMLRADSDLWLVPERQRRGTHLPASWLFPSAPSISCLGDELRITVGDEPVARYRYWHDELRERHYRNTHGRVGCELRVRRNWLEPQLSAGATLCWLATLRVSDRKRYEEEFEESGRLLNWTIGGSRMIWPQPWFVPEPST
jgi:hypothetical protein